MTRSGLRSPLATNCTRWSPGITRRHAFGVSPARRPSTYTVANGTAFTLRHTLSPLGGWVAETGRFGVSGAGARCSARGAADRWSGRGRGVSSGGAESDGFALTTIVSSAGRRGPGRDCSRTVAAGGDAAATSVSGPAAGAAIMIAPSGRRLEPAHVTVPSASTPTRPAARTGWRRPTRDRSRTARARPPAGGRAEATASPRALARARAVGYRASGALASARVTTAARAGGTAGARPRRAAGSVWTIA